MIFPSIGASYKEATNRHVYIAVIGRHESQSNIEVRLVAAPNKEKCILMCGGEDNVFHLESLTDSLQYLEMELAMISAGVIPTGGGDELRPH